MAPTCEVDSPDIGQNIKDGPDNFKRATGTVNSSLVHADLAHLKISKNQLLTTRSRFLHCVKHCLDGETGKKNNIAMLPTFVTDIPDGTEKGIYLALDLGGSNFRVVKVHLPDIKGDRVMVHSQVYKIPPHIMTGFAREFFDHIATCIADFVDHHGLKDQRLPLGFTFSFPCEQKGLDQSFLLRWTKGYNVSGVVGKDIVRLLQDAIKRQCEKDVKCFVDVVAVINDTVGTLMSCAYEDQNCSIGMIVGTGTNACYMENVDDMKILNISDSSESTSDRKSFRRMCVNTEWGAFGEDGSLDGVRTVFDKLVDKASVNPGFMIYEKMISSLYLGDIVREVLLHLIREGNLFDSVITDEIQQCHSFHTSFITQIELDRRPDLYVCNQILINLGYLDSTLSERLKIREICKMISTRSAHLCAAGVSALVERLKSSRRLSEDEILKVTVAVDGTLYKKHPTFKHILQTTVHELSPNSEVTFRISHDGSGKGAALVSAVACKNLNHQITK